MKIKPKEILVVLPIVLMFDSEDEIYTYAANINTIIHGKVRLKYEVLGQLSGKYAGLFYMQRNDESQELRDEFINLIDQEETQIYNDKIKSVEIITDKLK